MMNPARKKVPYPFCRISSMQKYNKVSSTNHSFCFTSEPSGTKEALSVPKSSNQKLYFEPLTITKEVLSIYEQSKALENSHRVNEYSSEELHFEILELIRENTELLSILNQFEEEIHHTREKLTNLE